MVGIPIVVSHAVRIAQIEPVGGHGGMHHYDIGLARGLAQAGAQVALYTSSIGRLEIGHARVEVVTAFRGSYGSQPRLLRAARYAVALERSLRAARRWGCDLLHLHAFGGTRLERFTLSRAIATGRPVVVTVHDVHHLGTEDTSRSLRAYYTRPRTLIAHNRFSRRAIQRIAHQTPVEEIPHGHYLDTFPAGPDEAAARRALGVDPAAFLLLFFGQIKPAKGLGLLLDALPRAVAERPEIRALIAGRAWRDDPENYLRGIRDLGLEERVDFRHGFVDDRQVPALFAAADLVILPYRHVYQSGVLLLAMSRGRAVLASDLPPMAEVVRDGTDGFLFRHGDSEHLAQRLVELAARPERLAAVGDAARARMRQRHDWRTIGEHTLAVYRRLLDRGDRSADAGR